MNEEDSFRDCRLEYLKRRLDSIIPQLEAQSIDGRFIHKCNTYITIITSSYRHASFDKDYDLDRLETAIVNAEHFIFTIAQSL